MYHQTFCAETLRKCQGRICALLHPPRRHENHASLSIARRTIRIGEHVSPRICIAPQRGESQKDTMKDERNGARHNRTLRTLSSIFMSSNVVNNAGRYILAPSELLTRHSSPSHNVRKLRYLRQVQGIFGRHLSRPWRMRRSRPYINVLSRL